MITKPDTPDTPDTHADAMPLQPDSDVADPTESDIDSALDEALEESFPASDPVAINIGKPPCPPT